MNTIPQIIIGNNVTFTDGVYISSINKVEIEDGVLCGGNVFITDNFHGKSEVDELDIRPNSDMSISDITDNLKITNSLFDKSKKSKFTKIG